MKKTSKIFLAASLLLCASAAEAEEKDLEAIIASDFVSQYIWRGQDLGSVAVQPTLGIGWKGLSLTAWGSYGLVDTNDAKELDLTLGYTIGHFNVGVTDYWFNQGPEPHDRYFMYKAHSTNHVFEANVGYDFGFASLQWYTNFAGNDGVCKSGDRAYSSYLEADVPFRLVGVGWDVAAGAVPYATDFYGARHFAVTNISLKATKEIRVTDSFHIPIFGQIAANPRNQKAYLIVGFTLQP